MWDIALTLAASLAIQQAQPQDQPRAQPQAATLESCEYIDERWVCRYRLPDIQLVEGGSAPPVPITAPVCVSFSSSSIFATPKSKIFTSGAPSE